MIGEALEARDFFRKGAQLNPDSPLVLGFQAGDAAEHGRYDEAVALARRVVSTDPLSARMMRSGLCSERD